MTGRELARRLHNATPPAVRKSAARRLPASVATRIVSGSGSPQWLREVMTADTRRVFSELRPEELDAVEFSGESWQALPWRSHATLEYPEFDLCAPPSVLPGPYDLVVCEQVLEHVLDPLVAVDTLRRLCRPDGHVFVSTPFLVRLHDHPGDYWRFTPAGLARLLASRELDPLWVRSWGNRRAILANFNTWVARFPWQSLRNEPRLPAVVWALARPRPAGAERPRN